ncbi:MAG: caspase family protein [Blastocatellia bacterium]
MGAIKRVLPPTVVVLLLESLILAQDRGMGVVRRPETERVALVIGNAAYQNSPLLNPTNDARDFAQALNRSGFEIIHKENATQNEMKRAIRLFGEKIRSGGVGLFYYAGHGMQVDGRNYLIPPEEVGTGRGCLSRSTPVGAK